MPAQEQPIALSFEETTLLQSCDRLIEYLGEVKAANGTPYNNYKVAVDRSS